MPKAISPPSPARRRGMPAAEPAEAEHAGHDAEAQRQDDDDQVLRVEAERRREVRPEDADHADERRGRRQMDQRPADLAVAADRGQALAQLVDRFAGAARRSTPGSRATGGADGRKKVTIVAAA